MGTIVDSIASICRQCGDQHIECTHNGFDMAPGSANIYSPLKEGQIRLVRLMSNGSGDLSCIMRTADISSTEPYYALSYVCGEGDEVHEITLEEFPFRVKQNLFRALHRLATHFRAMHTYSPWIWIDAVSVNQHDPREKAQQIRGMHLVFSKAKEVIVWLGDVPRNVQVFVLMLQCVVLSNSLGLEKTFSPEWFNNDSRSQVCSLHDVLSGSGLGFWTEEQRSLLHALGARMVLLQERHGISYLQSYAMMLLLAYAGVGDEAVRGAWVKQMFHDRPGMDRNVLPRNHEFWSGYFALPELEWFKRVWTYQEIQLAQEACILVGNYSVAWASLRDIVKHICKVVFWGLRYHIPFVELDKAVSNDDFISIASMCDANSAISWSWTQFDANQPLSSHPMQCLLSIARSRKATETKDRVYGLLGLREDRIRTAIKVDYTRKVENGDVFASAIKAILALDPTQLAVMWSTMFGPMFAPSKVVNLPSWCPDLEMGVASLWLLLLNVGHEPLWDNVLEHFGSFAKYDDLSDPKTISVNVLEIDAVAQCMSQSSPFDVDDLMIAPNADFDALFGEFNAWAEEMQHTFIVDLNSEEFENNAIVGLLTAMESDARNLFITARDGCRESRRTWLREYCNGLSTLSSRYYFRTRSGKAGFCTREVPDGARIVLVPPCTTLQLLTPDNTKYLGCTTVHGFTDDALLVLGLEQSDNWRMVTLE